jgi:hypothetical protein
MQIVTNPFKELIRCCALVKMLQQVQMIVVDRSIYDGCELDVFLHALHPLINTALNLTTIRHLNDSANVRDDLQL